LISGWSDWSRCIDFTPRKVSGRMKMRTVKVSRMIDQPHDPPSRSCQNSSTHWQASISGLRMFFIG
jgi:hypothetical protein